MKKSCPECGDKFQGRRDKVFCSAACRSTYNNRLNSDANNFVRNINNLLRKNRRILASLNPDGKTKVHKTKLLDAGFKFQYFTNQYITQGGKVYNFCYDQGYLELDKGYYALVYRKEYVA